MSDHQHPDLDTLNNFVEGVLPEHERAECLAHLADCPRCREIAFLAQEVPQAPILVAARRPRLMPLLAAAAVLCFAILGTWLYLRSRTAPPPPQMAAQVTPLPPTSETPPEIPAPAPRRKTTPKPPQSSPAPSPAPAPAPDTAPPPIPAPAGRGEVAPTAPPPPPALAIHKDVPPVEASSAISGTVTDPGGAAIPHVAVQLRQLAGSSTSDARTDETGKFKFTALAPGEYQLEITAPGFLRFSQRVEVKPREVAALEPRLQIGSTAETVEVSAASAQVIRPLPSKQPAEIVVTRGKVTLAVDSSGALFLSGNSGKSWKAVKSQWSGKIVDLVAQPAQFQLTTDAGANWQSPDGRRWHPAPQQR